VGAQVIDDRVASIQRSLLRRVLASGNAARLHVRFHAEVVDRYREMPGAQVIRTRTVGRINLPGKWSLDMGIVDGEGEIHVTVEDLLDRLPESERDHWLEHLVPTPASLNFMQMRLTPGACIDDGEPQAWTADGA
jgi:hypothetical protein